MSDGKPRQYKSTSAQWRKLKDVTKTMRKNPTPAEDALWQQLRRRQMCGLRFRRQHTISGFVVDFVCLPKQLVIEVDGGVHDMKEQRQYDEERQCILEGLGYHVLRFSNQAVLETMSDVLETIHRHIANLPDAE
jgi:very-short-patch-repair endonuclease